MPTLDSCHQQVVNALRKAGWDVHDKPLYLRVEELTGIADFDAQLPDNNPHQIIVVEVKCFVDQRFDQDELYRAVGQYLLYRSMLKIRKIEAPLYLAISATAYGRLFVKNVVSQVIRESQIKLIIIDLEQEEVLEWVN